MRPKFSLLHTVEDDVRDKSLMSIFDVLESDMVRLAQRTDDIKILDELSKSPNSAICLAVLESRYTHHLIINRLLYHDDIRVRDQAANKIEKLNGHESIISKVS